MGSEMATRLTDQHLARLSESERAKIKRARSIASWMDDKLKIGGFGVGLDGVIGLIPIAGDGFSVLMGLYHLKLAQDLKLGAGVSSSIVTNLAADFAVGFIPVLGDLLDFTYRSHRRNMKLIEKKLVERLEKGA